MLELLIEHAWNRVHEILARKAQPSVGCGKFHPILLLELVKRLYMKRRDFIKTTAPVTGGIVS
jgi:hypothetical protein